MAKAKKVIPAPKESKTSKVPKIEPAILEKKYIKSRPVCKVTFTLPREAAADAESVYLMGEFNNWSRDTHPLKREKNGDFATSLELEKGRSYRSGIS